MVGHDLPGTGVWDVDAWSPDFDDYVFSLADDPSTNAFTNQQGNAFEPSGAGSFPHFHVPSPQPFSEAVYPNHDQKKQIQSRSSSPLTRQISIRNGNPMKRPSKSGSASTRKTKLLSWGLDVQGRSDLGGDQEEDAASCTSSCSGSPCPSQCGADGQGSICCNDDNCTANDLCLNEACAGANSPCTDERCISERPVVVAAAAALTSFGDTTAADNHLGCEQSMAAFNQAYQFGAHYDPNNHGAGMDFTCSQAQNPNDALDSLLFDPFVSGHLAHNSQNQSWHQYPQTAQAIPMNIYEHYVRHHLQPQNESQHMRPCIVDHPNLMGGICCLPKVPVHGNQGLSLGQAYDYSVPCGFPMQNPTDFAQHLQSEHNSQLSYFPTHSNCFDFNAHQPEYLNCPNLGAHFSSSVALQQPEYHPTRFQPHSTRCGGAVTCHEPMSLSTPSEYDDYMSKTPVRTSCSMSLSPMNQSDKKQIDLSRLADIPDSSLADQLPEDEGEHRCRWQDLATGDVCNQVFTSTKSLHEHCCASHAQLAERENEKGSENGFKCTWEGCNRAKTFVQRGKLSRHLLVHTKFKPMSCNICGIELSAKQALEQHMRIHTDENPYECDFPNCGQTFKQKSALSRCLPEIRRSLAIAHINVAMHKRTHTGEKPLKCDHCDKTFRESSNLTKHRRTHFTHRQFVCNLCPKGFNRRDQLKRHLISNHKEHPELKQAIQRAESTKYSKMQPCASVKISPAKMCS